MEHLTEKHIREITTLVRAKGVEMEELLCDLVDHVCCMVEEKMEQGKNYTSALEESISSFGNNGIRNIQEETNYLLTKNILAMKKTMHIIGIASTIMLLVGAFFKIKHYPGAGILYLTGGFLLSFAFLPLLATVKIKEKLGKLRTWITILGVASAFVLINGIFFKIMHWPLANVLMNIGGGLLLFIYLPLAIYAAFKHKDIRTNTLTSIIIAVAGFTVMFSLVKVGNSHAVNNAIINIQYTINQDVDKANALNQNIFSSFNDSVISEDVKQLNQLVAKMDEMVKGFNFSLAKSQHLDITDEKLQTILASDYRVISDDLGDLSVLRNEEEGLQELLGLIDNYEKGYASLTGTSIDITYNENNIKYYMEKKNIFFPLGIVIHDLSLLNLQVQKTHTSLLQYIKGKVS